MLQGSLSETTRTCGSPGCRCQRGERHGPHTYLTFKTPEGRSSAVYVPAHWLREAQAGVRAWARFWTLAGELAAQNRDEAVARWRAARPGRRRRQAPTRRSGQRPFGPGLRGPGPDTAQRRGRPGGELRSSRCPPDPVERPAASNEAATQSHREISSFCVLNLSAAPKILLDRAGYGGVHTAASSEASRSH